MFSTAWITRPDLMVGVREIGRIDIDLSDEHLLLISSEMVPILQQFCPARASFFCVLRYHAEPVLVGDDESERAELIFLSFAIALPRFAPSTAENDACNTVPTFTPIELCKRAPAHRPAPGPAGATRQEHIIPMWRNSL
jgi:hypothetical protein